MRLPLSRIVGELRGQGARRFAGLLAGHLDVALEGARLAESVVRGQVDWSAARVRMRDVEHRGDRLRESLVGELSMALTTPIDREDLARVSRSVDDVLDNLRDFIRLGDLFGLGAVPALLPVIREIMLGLQALHDAVSALASGPGNVSRLTVVAGKGGGRIRRAYDYKLAQLLVGTVSMDVLKQREMLRRLDVVGLRLGEAADALADAAVKRSAGDPPRGKASP